MIISLDSETTGVDLHHGAKPFFVTICDENWRNTWWEWDVIPGTRDVDVPAKDVKDIVDCVDNADELILQNSKFDVTALGKLPNWPKGFKWPWNKVKDTLIGGHLLASNHRHDLNSMSIEYLAHDITQCEEDMKKAVDACRKIVNKKDSILGNWRIARKGLPDMPSIKPDGRDDDKPWKYDTWLPRAVVKYACTSFAFELLPPDPQQPTVGRLDGSTVAIDRSSKWGNPYHIGRDGTRQEVIAKYAHWIFKQDELLAALPDLHGKKLGCHCSPELCHGDVLRALCHPWFTVTQVYGNTDSAVTLGIHAKQIELINKRGLMPIYQRRLKLLSITTKMEELGVTANHERLTEIETQFTEEAETAEKICLNIASGYDDYQLVLPKSGNNKSLTEFVFDKMKLPAIKRSNKTGEPSLDKNVLEAYEVSLPARSKQLQFVLSLRDKRKRDKALQDIAGYRRFWIPMEIFNERGEQLWYLLHPHLNMTGTDTLRWSSNNPNEQNICFDCDTEILTTTGWIRADELTNEHQVAQYWKETEEIEFVNPVLVKQHFKGMMQHIKTEDHIDMMLTPAHRCLLQHRKTLKKFEVRADQFKGDQYHLHAGVYKNGSESLSPSEVTWLCAVQADGSYATVGDTKYGIGFSFRKKRKIERLRNCLIQLGAAYTERTTKLGVAFYVGTNEPIVLLAKKLMPDKCFGPWLLNYDRTTLDKFCTEVFLWDGTSKTSREYSSSHKSNADWIQILWTLSGRRARMRLYHPSNRPDYDHWIVGTPQKPAGYSGTSNFIKEEIPWDGPVYCVTVPSSFVVIRRNGKVSITGNSKQDITGREGFNLRYIFGPAPGREWWSLDAQNIELRLPAYESGEPEIISIFEEPDAPPYYGSTHLLNFHTVYPDIWDSALKESSFDKVGPLCKKKYKSTWYQYCKNGGFAVQYGAVEREEGTADKAFHRVGSHARLQARFSKLQELNGYWIRYANKNGYVETMPDKSLDMDRGYPLLCTRSQWGSILPTVPLNYHVQGSACWWMCQAMIRCQGLLDSWESSGFNAWMTMQVHDELVFDMPAGKGVQPYRTNLARVRELAKTMAQGGNDVGVPTPVGIEYHSKVWSEGITMEAA